MCDAAYLCQVEQLERSHLAQVALLPHVEEKDRKSFPSLDEVRAEFDSWLVTEPDQDAGIDPETELMYRFLGVGKR